MCRPPVPERGEVPEGEVGGHARLPALQGAVAHGVHLELVAGRPLPLETVEHLADLGRLRAHTQVMKGPEAGRGDQASGRHVVVRAPAIEMKGALQGPRLGVAVVIGAEVLVRQSLVDGPEADDAVDRPLPMQGAIPGRFHETCRLREDVGGVMRRLSQSVGDLGPRDDPGVKEPLCQDPVLPSPPSVAQLEHEIPCFMGYEMQISNG